MGSRDVAEPAQRAVSPPLGALRRTGRELGLALIVAGIIVLLFVVYQLLGTTFAEQRSQAALAHAFDRTLAQRAGSAATPAPRSAPTPTADAPTVDPGRTATPDLSPSTPLGSAIEHLRIPRIGLDKYVVQGTAEQDLVQGPGHYVGTPFPGQKGNAAIAGHRTTYGAPFFRLNELVAGDKIYITDTSGRSFVYSVVRQTIAAPTGPSAAAVLADTADAQLTLTTCNPRFEATNRLVVVADLVGRPASAPVAPVATSPVATSTSAGPDRTKPVAALPAAETNLGAGNAGGWLPAIAYGAAVVGLWTMTRLLVNRTRRWRRAACLIGGIAVVAVPLWFCFENVVRILPSSL